VKGLFPDLVQEDETGFYRINYVEFIPIIIDGFKRLNKKVEDQEKRIEELENKIMTKDMNNGCKDDCE
jgi:cell division septum initiation protein DivIVA